MAKKEENNLQENASVKIDIFQYADDMADIDQVLRKQLEAAANNPSRQGRSKQLDDLCKSAYTVARAIQNDAEKCEEFAELLKNMGETFLQLGNELDARVEFLRGNIPLSDERRIGPGDTRLR